MKIFTLSASPYLFTKLGKMNSDLLLHLKSQGYEVGSIVWHLNTSWYLPDETDNKYKYEVDNNIVCDLFPFIPHPEQSTPVIYDIIKQEKPDVIISIGDYHQFSHLCAIKGLEPQSFKWIGVFTVDALPINEGEIEIFNYVDVAIATTKSAKEAIQKIKGSCEYIPYGSHLDKLNSDVKVNDSKLKLVTCAKNAQASNIAGLLKAIMIANKENNGQIECYLNTNYSDAGEYDLDLLIKRYGIKDYIKLPDCYTSLNDGMPFEDLVNIYKDSDVVVDISVRSATGLSVLEGMACGCIPVCSPVGALEEIIDKLPKDYQFFPRTNTYIGSYEEEYKIVSIKDLAKIFSMLLKIKKDKIKFCEIKSKCVEVSKRFSHKDFVETVDKIISSLELDKKFLEVEIM